MRDSTRNSAMNSLNFLHQWDNNNIAPCRPGPKTIDEKSKMAFPAWSNTMGIFFEWCTTLQALDSRSSQRIKGNQPWWLRHLIHSARPQPQGGGHTGGPRRGDRGSHGAISELIGDGEALRCPHRRCSNRIARRNHARPGRVGRDHQHGHGVDDYDSRHSPDRALERVPR